MPFRLCAATHGHGHGHGHGGAGAPHDPMHAATTAKVVEGARQRKARKKTTPLQRKLHKVGLAMALTGLSVCVIVFIVGMIRGACSN